MSQIIRSEKISKRGKDIEEYLNSIYLEPWFSKTKKLEKYEENKSNICSYYNQQPEKPY